MIHHYSLLSYIIFSTTAKTFLKCQWGLLGIPPKPNKIHKAMYFTWNCTDKSGHNILFSRDQNTLLSQIYSQCCRNQHGQSTEWEQIFTSHLSDEKDLYLEYRTLLTQ